MADKTTWMRIASILLASGLLLACPYTKVKPVEDEPAHPFQDSIKDVITSPPDHVAEQVRAHEVALPAGIAAEPVELLATPEVSDAAMTYLAKQLRVVGGDFGRRKDLAQMVGKKPVLQRGEPEVWLPQARNPNGGPLFLLWPDAWEMVRPGVIRLKPSYRDMQQEPASRDDSVGRATAAIVGNWTAAEGTLMCQPPSTPAAAAVPVPFAAIEIEGATSNTRADGTFTVGGSFLEITRMLVRYDGTVQTTGTAATSGIQVMDDGHAARSEWIDIDSGSPATGTVNVGVLTLTSLDCELYQLGVQAVDGYQSIVGNSHPAGRFRIKRWGGDVVSGAYSFYDYALFPTDYLAEAPGRAWRTETVFHEFGHTVRHRADGDEGHWNWDNFRWAYARNHNTREIFNEHYAFNEGWGQYWECTRPGAGGVCPFVSGDHPGVGFRDWNEMRVAEQLMDLANEPGVGHATMDAILRANPGSIHRLIEFEQRYCSTVTLPNPFCASAGTPARTKPDCPPGWADHGATCYQQDVVGKPSEGRGVGTLPLGCGPATEEDAGLCYAPCPAGWDGVGPLCWQDCPAGMHDDGAFCRRDVNIRASDNSACPWWDICGLTFASGCSTCPAGFQNDGCTCRIDAWIFAKATQGRGVGTPMTDCGPGREYDAGLCYPLCPGTMNGVGPVCWGDCPAGFDDHGATCYRPPNIIVKF